MNSSVRNLLLSAFSWSPDRLVKLQRWLQFPWISGCTKSTVPFPERCDECGEVQCNSQELSYNLLLQKVWSGSQKPENILVRDDSSHSPFLKIFPLASIPGLFLTRTLVLAQRLFLQVNKQTSGTTHTLMSSYNQRQ